MSGAKDYAFLIFLYSGIAKGIAGALWFLAQSFYYRLKKRKNFIFNFFGVLALWLAFPFICLLVFYGILLFS